METYMHGSYGAGTQRWVLATRPVFGRQITEGSEGVDPKCTEGYQREESRVGLKLHEGVEKKRITAKNAH
jgi:hypothetical protein